MVTRCVVMVTRCVVMVTRCVVMVTRCVVMVTRCVMMILGSLLDAPLKQCYYKPIVMMVRDNCMSQHYYIGK